MKNVTTTQVFFMSIDHLMKTVRTVWLRRRVSYWRAARAESIFAQEQERKRQRNIECRLAECSADLKMIERN